MKKSFLVTIGMLIPIFSFAQQVSNISFKAVIADSNNRQPLAYAIVSLKSAQGKTVSQQADENGRIVIRSIFTGPYTLGVSMMGYWPYAKNVHLSSGNVDTVWQILLQSKSVSLEQMTISGRKNLIESFGGGFQFNPDDKSINKTGTAVDLLAQVPGISAENNDDIKLKGNTARIMVNGKLLNLSGQELQNYLKGISAERIVAITVNTNPSAKYDALTSGGLIDIKLKSKYEQGVFGTIASKYESLPGTWNGLNIDYTKNKFTYSLGLTYLYRKDLYLRNNYIQNKQDNPENAVNIQQAQMPQKQEVLTPSIEINYAIDSTSYLNIAANFPLFHNRFPSILRSDNLDRQGKPSGYFLQDEKVNYNGNYYTYNLNYTRNFKQKDEQFCLGGFYTKTRFNPFNYFSRSYFTPDQKPAPERSLLLESNSNRIYKSSQVQTDYTLPLSAERKLAFGLKASYSVIDNDNSADLFDFATAGFNRAPLLSSSLKYRENISAAYALYTQHIKKLSYSLGLRYEYSTVRINSSTTGQAYGQDYGNLFPNAALSYKLSDFQSIDFSYARKIDRPPYDLLDPFVNISDPNNYQTGNPFLNPAYSNKLELQYTKQCTAANSIILTLAYNQTKDSYLYPITTYSPVYNHVITTNTNATGLKNLALSAIGNYKINSWWQLNSYIGLSNGSLSTDSLNNIYYKPKPYFSGSLRNTFTLSPQTFFRLTGFYNSNSYEFQAKRRGIGSVNAGIQQSLFGKRLTINLDMYDIFKTKNYGYTVNSAYYEQYAYTQIKSRYFSIALSYSFGKKLAKPEVKKLSNERIDQQ